jgi:DNA-3-methyladenine glycosylase
MFQRPGLAYVYFTYGMHWCVNVVAHHEGEAGAVLIRAGEVVEGVEAAALRRPAATPTRDLARGPARLTQCLGITGEHDGIDLLDPGAAVQLHLVPMLVPVGRVRRGPRVGVGGDGASAAWRFHLSGDPFVSSYRPGRQRPGQGA